MKNNAHTEWFALLSSLEHIIPVYENMNKRMSLGLLARIRMKLLDSIRENPSILVDIGCGPGITGYSMLKLGKTQHVVFVDPSSRMLKVASFFIKRKDMDAKADFIIAVAEYLPIREGSVNAVTATFSIRDTFNLPRALRSVLSILKPSGKFYILDLYKPASTLLRIALDIYWFTMPRLVSIISNKKLYREYGKLHETFRKFPTVLEISSLASNSGGKTLWERVFLGAVLIIIEKLN